MNKEEVIGYGFFIRTAKKDICPIQRIGRFLFSKELQTSLNIQTTSSKKEKTNKIMILTAQRQFNIMNEGTNFN